MRCIDCGSELIWGADLIQRLKKINIMLDYVNFLILKP